MSFTRRDSVGKTMRTMEKGGTVRGILWQRKNREEKNGSVNERLLPWDRGRHVEWLKRSQKGSRNQQHRGHWGWPDPEWSSTDLLDSRSSRPRTLHLKQEDDSEHSQVKFKLRIPHSDGAENANFMAGASKCCTSGVTNTAKRAWNWGEAPCWTIVAHRARAILREPVGALRRRLRSSTLAEVTLQTRT